MRVWYVTSSFFQLLSSRQTDRAIPALLVGKSINAAFLVIRCNEINYRMLIKFVKLLKRRIRKILLQFVRHASQVVRDARRPTLLKVRVIFGSDLKCSVFNSQRSRQVVGEKSGTYGNRTHPGKLSFPTTVLKTAHHTSDDSSPRFLLTLCAGCFIPFIYRY